MHLFRGLRSRHLEVTISNLFHHVFWIGWISYFCANVLVISNLPYGFTTSVGGPDEEMHRSVVEFLATHHAWPDFDSDELMRTATGVSYSTGSSFGYWLHALGVELFSLHRLGGFLLFGLLLAGLGRIQRNSTAAGIVGLAMLTPQVVFIFSYENSDAWLFFVGTLLGYCCANVMLDRANSGKIWALVAVAALVPSTRFHLWPPGFLTFAVALYMARDGLRRMQPKQLLGVFLTGVAIASWWPITSYLHNAGDPVGFAATFKGRQLFATQPDSQLTPAFAEFPWSDFFKVTSKSFYGWWGMVNVNPSQSDYLLAATLAAGLLLTAWVVGRGTWLLLGSCLMLSALALMLVYSTGYDYQPQGRYLFCGYAIVLGAVVLNISRLQSEMSRRVQITVSALACCLVLVNVHSVYTLMHGESLFAKDLHVRVEREGELAPLGELACAIDQIFTNGAISEGRDRGASGDLRIGGWAFPNERGGAWTSLHIALKSSESTSVYRFETDVVYRPDVRRHVRKARSSYVGFVMRTSAIEPLPPGKYQIWVEVKQGATAYVHDTGVEATISRT